MTRKTQTIVRDGNSPGEYLANNGNVSAGTLGNGQTTDARSAIITEPASLNPTSATFSAAAASTGFPDAGTTGMPDGIQTTSHSGTLRITENNAVISNMVITGDVIIDADNVTLKNCKIISTNEYWGVRVMDGASGFKMTDSEVDGQGKTANAVNGFGTFLRNDIHGAENGINVTGPSLIQDNYIHGLLNRNGSPHYDGIQVDGGHDVQILHNTVINDYGQTAAVMLDNYFDGLSNITVDGNRLVGGGYTVYVDGSFDGGTVVDSSIRITNNQVGGGGYGDFAFYDEHPVVSGNTGLDEMPGGGVVDPGPGPNPDPDPNPDPSATTIKGTEGNDILPATGQSNTGDETYQGLGGNDILKGGAGADALDGGDGTDMASYEGSNAAAYVNLQAGTASGGHAAGDVLTNIENLTGSDYADGLTGNSGNNRLEGKAGADRLAGGGGRDTLAGGLGQDILTGGAGSDRFVFDVHELGRSNADRITDFGWRDMIGLDVDGATGGLSNRSFVTGTNARDANDHFIFDPDTASLYYDADGSGSGAKALVATFEDGVRIDVSDIFLL